MISLKPTEQKTILPLSVECYCLKFLDKTLQEPWDSSSSTPPLISNLMSTWRHARDSFSQAFPLRFCIQFAIKNWRRERPGNEAIKQELPFYMARAADVGTDIELLTWWKEARQWPSLLV